MTRQEALDQLAEVRDAMRQQFSDEFGTHDARLAAMEGAHDTMAMHIEKLHDVEEQEQDLARRILGRETVHGGDEVRDHSGRSMAHIRAIAARAGS